jgi:hypothetical protein
MLASFFDAGKTKSLLGKRRLIRCGASMNLGSAQANFRFVTNMS